MRWITACHEAHFISISADDVLYLEAALNGPENAWSDIKVDIVREAWRCDFIARRSIAAKECFQDVLGF